MADQIQFQYDVSGASPYAQIRDSAGLIWNGSAFVSYNTANVSLYAINMTEQGSASAYYVCTFPATISAGVYSVVIKRKTTGSYLESDAPLTGGQMEWDGTQIVPLYTRLAPTVASRTLDVTATGAAGIDWGNVENPTTTLALTNTSINGASIAAATWNALTASYNTANTFGAYVQALPTSAATASQIWSTAVPGSFGSGSAGYILGNNLDVAVSTRSDLDATDVEDAVWDAAVADHTTAGTFGEAVGSGPSAADVWTYPSRSLTTGTAIDMTQALPGTPGSSTVGEALKFITTRLDTTVSSRGTGDAEEASVQDAISDLATLLSRLTSTRAGYLDNLASGFPNTTDISTAVWDKSLAAYTTTNAAGTLVLNAATATALGTVATNVNTLLGRLTSTRAGYLDNLSVAPPTAATIATAVWDKNISAYSTGGLAGTYLNSASTVSTSAIATAVWQTDVSAYATAGQAGTYQKGIPTVAQIWANGTRTITGTVSLDLTQAVGASQTSGTTGKALRNVIDNLTAVPPTAAANAAAVWDLTTTGHNTSGTFGNVVQNAASASAIATAVWNTAVPGSFGAGTAGKILGDNLDAPISDISVDSAAAVWDALVADHNVTGSFGAANRTTVSAYIAAIQAAGVTLTSASMNAVATALLDLTDGIESGITLRQATRGIASALCGKVSGAGTGVETFKGIGNDTTRMVNNVTSQGNRTAVTLTL